MGLPLSNAYVKPHLVYTSISCMWMCVTAVLNPFYRRGEPQDMRRCLLVNTPYGVGTTPLTAYRDWANRTVST